MSRSIKKGPFVHAKLLARVKEMNEKGEKKVLKTWSRSSILQSSTTAATITITISKTRSGASSKITAMKPA